jgi:hypothetical protein
MGYYIDLFEVSVNDFYQSLISKKLLPSQQALLNNIEAIFQNLIDSDITNIGELQQKLKTKTKRLLFAKQTTIDLKYLTVLRREINSLQPEPRAITGFTYLSQVMKDKLASLGIKTTLQLFNDIKNIEVRLRLSEKLNCTLEEVNYLKQLVDVSRLRYVNQTFATLLVACGYDSITKIKNANGSELYKDLINYNCSHHLYKGKIGINDMYFFIQSVPENIELI